jgi:hypothetical protein
VLTFSASFWYTKHVKQGGTERGCRMTQYELQIILVALAAIFCFMSLAMLTMMSNSLRKIAEQIEILVKRAPMQVRMTESEIKENARVK